MLFVFGAIAFVKLVEICVCTVPTKAVEMKRMHKETAKRDSNGDPANRVFVEGVILAVKDVREMAACPNGCGKKFKDGVELVPVAGPAMVAGGKLTHCNNCGCYKNAA